MWPELEPVLQNWKRLEIAGLSTVLQASVRSLPGGIVQADWPLFSLPSMVCEAAGGSAELALEVDAAWISLYLAAHFLDQIADEEQDLQARGAFAALAAGLMASAELALSEIREDRVPPEARHDIQMAFRLATLKASEGQMRELQQPEPPLAVCWEIAAAKTGSAYTAACYAGARLATADAERIAHFQEFGRRLGLLVQIQDDLQGILKDGAGDLEQRKWTLPIAYAMQTLPEPEQVLLRKQLCAASTKKESAQAARQMVVQSGALLYLVVESEYHRQAARQALTCAAPVDPGRGTLERLLNWLIPD